MLVTKIFISGLMKIWTASLLSSNNKVLDWSNLKAFADDKIHVTAKLKFAMGRVENLGYQHFLLFPQCFQKVIKRVVQGS